MQWSASTTRSSTQIYIMTMVWLRWLAERSVNIRLLFVRFWGFSMPNGCSVWNVVAVNRQIYLVRTSESGAAEKKKTKSFSVKLNNVW